MAARHWVLAAKPGRELNLSDFELRAFTPREPQAGEVLVALDHHTIAPGARVKMMAATYTDQVKIGEAIPGDGAGVVQASRHPDFAPGDRVTGFLEWGTHAVAKGDFLQKLPGALFAGGVPLSASVGVFGMSGLTAYFGLLKIGALKPGETVLVSSAAGAVGSVVGQIARVHGCRVVGIVGSEEKRADILANCGYDAAVNYRQHPGEEALSAAIRAACPDGVDVFFDNVGAETLRAGFRNTRMFSRTVICGALAQYGDLSDVGLPAFRPGYRQRVEAFVVVDYARDFPAARQEMAQWISDGKLRPSPTIVPGIDKAAAAFLAQFQSGGPSRPIVAVN